MGRMVRSPFLSNFRPHRVCGITCGFWCKSVRGQKFYLAVREGSLSRGILRDGDCWCMDERTLDMCKLDGIEVIFLAHKVGRKHVRHHFYATLLEDFYGPFSSQRIGVTPGGSCRQRALPRRVWRVSPVMDSVARQVSVK